MYASDTHGEDVAAVASGPGWCSTLVEALTRHGEHRPSSHAGTFLDDDGGERNITFGHLHRQARAIAATLQAAGMEGERALLLYPPSIEYVAGFFGCIYARTIAVPAYPPTPSRINRLLPRLQAIVRDSQAKVVLTTREVLQFAEMLFAFAPEFADLTWIATDTVAIETGDAWQDPGVVPDTVAFLQYTSGSTREPHGVTLTHGNLIHNLDCIWRLFGHDARKRGVIWLPPYHDMGLIGGVLQPVYIGGQVTLMSPLAFLRRPGRWLTAISERRATTSGGPNFAYDLCVRKIPLHEREKLDLSSWEVAFNGAEPVRHDTMERFTNAFAPYGFRREAFYPCYGLAEATLIASGGRKGSGWTTISIDPTELTRNRVFLADGDGPARKVVSSGQTLSDQLCVIVDPETNERCPPDLVGEIWLSGPSVANGYWNRPEATRHAFQARLADGTGPFLRTGDLGFLRDGSLFITGRLKDLLIVDGRNHYPQDIEVTVEESHPLVRVGCCAAVIVEDQVGLNLVIVTELDLQQPPSSEVAEEIRRAIRRAVAEGHDIRVYDIVLVKKDTIPKTSSGKIQRYACAEAWRSDSLEPISAA